MADDNRSRKEHDASGEHQRGARKEPTYVAMDGGQRRVGIDSAEADRRELGPGERPGSKSLLAMPQKQLVALARGVADHQSRFVQSAQKGPELGFGDRPRRELAGKLARHLGEAHRPAEHFQQRVFLARKMKVLERERIPHDPRRRAGHLHRHRDQVGPQAQGEGAVVGGDGRGHSEASANCKMRSANCKF